MDQTNEENSQIFDWFYRLSHIKKQKERERQKNEALKGYQELKQINNKYPTAKRTKFLEEMEKRLRENGILQ